MSDIEKQIALRNAAEIVESNAYFSARPTADTNDRRNVFEAGFRSTCASLRRRGCQ